MDGLENRCNYCAWNTGKNGNGRRVIDLFAKRGLCRQCIFKHKSLHIYARVPRVQGGMEIMIVIHLVVVRRDVLKFAYDVKLTMLKWWLILQEKCVAH